VPVFVNFYALPPLSGSRAVSKRLNFRRLENQKTLGESANGYLSAWASRYFRICRARLSLISACLGDRLRFLGPWVLIPVVLRSVLYE